MAMRLKKRIEEAKKALRGNSGAGLLVVVITALVVLLLGSALLYASYNVYVLRLTQRKSETNFTSADAGMEEIRAGLQGVSSDAIGAGYDNVIAPSGPATTMSSQTTPAGPRRKPSATAISSASSIGRTRIM